MRSRHCTPAWVTRAKLRLKKKKSNNGRCHNKETVMVAVMIVVIGGSVVGVTRIMIRK